jgi:hypothetical protein
MYNTKDIQFTGKHDYDKDSAERYAAWAEKSFSVNIFQWVAKRNGKEMKPSKCVVRVHGKPCDKVKVLEACETIVKKLDEGVWDGRKSVRVS